jgi:hypothetical protein
MSAAMRLLASVSAVVAIALLAATAGATVTEPNGLAVPKASSGEEQLSTFFASRGEGINWQTDAHDTPNAFSPLCGFTATYVLNQAASHFGLSWYNDTGTQPQASDLYALVPPNSPVGTSFSGTVIKNDPNYKGGVVGFALVGGETHYSNASYDTVCTGCSPPGPWITALVYASTVTADAYYICFEDGATSATGWNNDGDFNDDVYFVTGISCSGGGVPCDTGQPGICAPGLTQCVAGGTTTCQGVNKPSPTETCNGLDDNCNGQVDEGNPCPEEYVCYEGACVKSCAGGEFPCPTGLVCNAVGYCVDPSCENVTCPAGQVCKNGTCKAPCDGVTCPYPQTCRVGACVDPCAGVNCAQGEVCTGGVCVTSCSCQPCGQGEACNATSGSCVEPACATVSCPGGQHCAAGACVDDCKGAVCPGGAACTAGKCAAPSDAGAPVDAGGGLTGPGSDGGSGSSGDDASTGGTKGDGGKDAGYGAFVAPSKGCSCEVMGGGGSGDALFAGAGVFAALALARTRRRRRRGEDGVSPSR